MKINLGKIEKYAMKVLTALATIVVILSIYFFINNIEQTSIEVTDCKIESMVEFICEDGQSGYLKPDNYAKIVNVSNCTQLNDDGYTCVPLQ